MPEGTQLHAPTLSNLAQLTGLATCLSHQVTDTSLQHILTVSDHVLSAYMHCVQQTPTSHLSMFLSSEELTGSPP